MVMVRAYGWSVAALLWAVNLVVAAYGAEVHHFGPDGAPVDLVQFPSADVAGVARSLGFQAATVRRAADLEVLTGWLAAGRRSPLLLDAKVVPTVVAEWLEEAFRGH